MPKLQDFKQEKPEYIAITLLFYSFFGVMIFLVLFRLFGWKHFLIQYETKEIGEFGESLIRNLSKLVESLIIAFILFKQRWWINCIIAFSYAILLFIPHPNYVETIGDLVYMMVVPLIFNKNRLRSLLHSLALFALMLGYQSLMLFARYEFDFTLQYNWYLHILTILDYKVFLLTTLLFIKRRQLWKKIKSTTAIKTKTLKKDGVHKVEVSSSLDQKQSSKR